MLISTVLLLHDSHAEAPEIPRWYFHYARSGDGRFLDPLLRHNAQDVLSLVLLLRHLVRFLADRGPNTRATHLARGRVLERAGHDDAAMAQFQCARGSDDGIHQEATARLGRLLKRRGRRDEAVPLWEELAGLPGGGAALLDLAKDREHRQRVRRKRARAESESRLVS